MGILDYKKKIVVKLSQKNSAPQASFPFEVQLAFEKYLKEFLPVFPHWINMIVRKIDIRYHCALKSDEEKETI